MMMMMMVMIMMWMWMWTTTMMMLRMMMNFQIDTCNDCLNQTRQALQHHNTSIRSWEFWWQTMLVFPIVLQHIFWKKSKTSESSEVSAFSGNTSMRSMMVPSTTSWRLSWTRMVCCRDLRAHWKGRDRDTEHPSFDGINPAPCNRQFVPLVARSF